jgi:single-stranded-DNA-specific exonuclease
MTVWIDPPAPTEDAEALAAALKVSGLIAQVLTRRGLTDVDAVRRFLDPELYNPAPPSDLPDMDRAVVRILRAINSGERIAIWGDFDVDGQTATALLVEALDSLGGDVMYSIPDRLAEGHGVHIPRLRDMIAAGAQLIVTCDTGVAAHEAVDFANGQGVDVIVTDHHLLPPELPNAHAVVNPQRLNPNHPLRTLPGVGVAYKLVEALYARFDRQDDELRSLDLVALGIVADVAEIRGDTRYLLQVGLDMLRQTERPGLCAMIENSGLMAAYINTEDIGFGLAPRLNALGRLADANLAVELLTTHDEGRARILANQLEGYNAERQMHTSNVTAAAQQQLADQPSLLNHAVIVLADPLWPGGIVGIVANRLVEQYNRPAILGKLGEDGVIRGSARSVAGVDITAALAEVDARNAGLIINFGGHTMAAGVSFPAGRLNEFRYELSQAVSATRSEPDGRLAIDAYLPLQAVDLALVDSLGQLGPFGQGNPPLTLATLSVTLTGERYLGQKKNHVRLRVEDPAGTRQNVLWWNADMDHMPSGRFDVAYRISDNVYQGNREVRLELVDFRPVESPDQFEPEAVEVVDYRHLSQGNQMAELILIDGDHVIWNEGAPVPGIEGQRRDQLRPAQTLVIWTAPPDSGELSRVLKVVNPARVVLFGVNPGTDSLTVFLERFGGVVKHVLKSRAAPVGLREIASAVGQRLDTVRAGLDWLVARQHIHVEYVNGDSIRIVDTGRLPGDTLIVSNINKTNTRLMSLLQETAAYRAYFRRADPESLLGHESNH